MAEPPVNWNGIWVAVQELGAALRPVIECEGAPPPEWAKKLADVLDEASDRVSDICQEQTADDAIVEYISRMPATIKNVASHFGMPMKEAHDTLVRLEDAKLIRPVGRQSWEIVSNAE